MKTLPNRWRLLLVMALLVAAPASAVRLDVTVEELKQLDLQQAALEYMDRKGAEVMKQALIDSQTELLNALKATPGMKNNPYVANLEAVLANTGQLDAWAQALASGEPQQMLAAQQQMSEQLADGLAEALAEGPMRQAMKGLLANKELVAEGAGALAWALEGDVRPGARLLGTSLLNLTPIGPVVNFYQGAYGLMESAKEGFVSSEMNRLYASFRDSHINEEELSERLDSSYAEFVRDRMTELRASRIEDIRGSGLSPGDVLYERLTSVDEEAVKADILASFHRRQAMEEQRARIAAARQRAEAEFPIILRAVEAEMADATPERRRMLAAYLQQGFLNSVDRMIANDPALQDMASREQQLRAAAAYQAFRFLHNDEPERIQARLNEVRQWRERAAERSVRDRIAHADVRTRIGARRAAIRERLHARLPRLSHAKLDALLDIVPPQAKTSLFQCLCTRNAGIGVGKSYSPAGGRPCLISGFGETRHPFPGDAGSWEYCMQSVRVGARNDSQGNVVSQGTPFDEYVAYAIISRTQ